MTREETYAAHHRTDGGRNGFHGGSNWRSTATGTEGGTILQALGIAAKPAAK